jgi:hypothetical protein
MIGATVVRYKVAKTKEEATRVDWQIGIAIVSEPGVSDVLALWSKDGKEVKAKEVWDYLRMEWRGAIAIEPAVF